MSKTSSTISGNADASVQLALPDNYSEILAIIPFGYGAGADNATLLRFVSITTAGLLSVHTYGSTSQKYAIAYWVIYK